MENTAKLWGIPKVPGLLAEKQSLPEALDNRAEAEIAALYQPRGEFETTNAYRQRIKIGKGEEQPIRDRYARLLAEENARLDAELALAVLESRREITPSGADLGTYEADRQVFPITLVGKSYEVRVPLAEALEIKNRFGSLKITGEKQFNIDGTVEHFNFKLLDPQTGARYPFGPQRDGAGAVTAVVATRSLVPPELSMRVAFSETNGNGFLDAGETGQIKASLVNSGQGAAIGVNLGIDSPTSDPALSFASNSYIGDIPPGKTVTATIDIIA